MRVLTRQPHCAAPVHGLPAAMSHATAEAKQLLRKSVKAALRQLENSSMQRESETICTAVLQSPLIDQATTFGVYVHAERLREVDTTTILQSLLSRGPSARCYVPLVMDNASNMKMLHLDNMDGLQAVPPYGIREPSQKYANGSEREDVLATSSPLDMLIMPGLAFDTRGGRLGRGGGYYDRFISRCKSHAQQHGRPPPLLVALAYKAQLLEYVPMLEHDERIDVLVTADAVFRCSKRAESF